MIGHDMLSATREMTQYPQQNEEPDSGGPLFYVQTNFCTEVHSLRSQFDAAIAGSQETDDSSIALTYAFRQDAYQFLTASSERLFARDAVEALMEQLRLWANAAVEASHVSTPQARVFINGCRRDFAQDDVTAQWHYILSLTRKETKKPTCVELLSRKLSANDGQSAVDEVTSFRLEFNQLLVHRTDCAYAIRPLKASMNPLEGVLFLDGYLW